MLGLCYVYNWKNSKRYNLKRPKISLPSTGFSFGTMKCFRIRQIGHTTLWLNITELFTLKWLSESHLNKKTSLLHGVYILMGEGKSVVKQLKYMVYKMSINSEWMDKFGIPIQHNTTQQQREIH